MTVPSDRTILCFDPTDGSRPDSGDRMILISSPHVEELCPDFRTATRQAETWIVMTDLIAVRSFLNALPADLDLDDFRICAPGAASADILRTANIHCDLIPIPNDPASTVSAIESYTGSVNGATVWVIGSTVGSESFMRHLVERGATAETIEVYRITEANSVDIGRLRALIIGGGINEIRFGREFDAEFFKSIGLGPEVVTGIEVTCTDVKIVNAAIESGFVRVRSLR